MKFRNKILLAIWGVVSGLLIVTFITINYWMRIQIQSRFAEDLRGNYSTINEITQLRREQDLRTCQVVAETPRLKAIVDLPDPRAALQRTALQLSMELSRSLAADLFVLSDSQGTMLVGLIGGKPADTVASARTLPNSIVRRIGEDLFRTASAPVVIGGDTVGGVTVGFTIKRPDLEFLKSLTNSDVVLLADGHLCKSTLTPPEEAEIVRWLEAAGSFPPVVGHVGDAFTVNAPSEEYKAVIYPLAGESSWTGYMLLKPIERVVKAATAPVLNTFFVVFLIVFVITGGIAYLISGGINRPIAALVRGTGEISRGNYDYRIDMRTGGELRFLAQKFEEMSSSLKEKIQQLADRNAELERALHQLKDTEEELVKSERLAATGKITAQISHEVNNPIHNIQSCLQTALKRFPPGTPSRDLLEVAFEETERLSKLTRQLLDFYRTSVVKEEFQPVDFNAVISDVIASSRQMLHEAGVAVRLDLEDGLPPISGSSDKLKQVILNLVINAKDAMRGGGNLAISTSRDTDGVTVSVSDTGVGIPPENIHRIFDAFFTTKSKVSGVGLGLSVTYGIVKQHGGTIEVRSVPNGGTSFTLRFPIYHQKTD